MDKSIDLAVGGKYPFPFPGFVGATANFLTGAGNALQLCIPDLTGDEIKALKKGKIEGGFIYDAGNLLWLFKLYDKTGPVFTLDAPFDARLIPRDILNLHDITNAQQHLVIELHVFDERRIIKALREVTIPPALTFAFLSAVQDQLSVPPIDPPNTWLALSPHDLARAAEMYTFGG